MRLLEPSPAVVPMMRILVVLFLVLASAAVARGGTVGVVVTGEPAMQPQLVSQLEAWLQARGYQLVPSPLPPDAVNALIDCFVIEDEGCARAVIVQRSKADAVVFARVDIQPGSDLEKTVIVLAYWFEKGAPAVAERRSCQRCTEPTLRSTADEIIEALAKAGQKQGLGALRLTSTPPGASVWIDGKEVGVTPLDHKVGPGTHEITFRHAGDQLARTVEVVAGQVTPLDVTLASGRGSSRGRVGAIATMVVGGVLVATGAILIAIDEDPARDKPPQIRDSAPAGIGFGLAGLAITAGGYVWFRNTTQRVSAPIAGVSRGGGFIGWVHRF
jgi:hypothetical protein